MHWRGTTSPPPSVAGDAPESIWRAFHSYSTHPTSEATGERTAAGTRYHCTSGSSILRPGVDEEAAAPGPILRLIDSQAGDRAQPGFD
jgi:hypothetical protein